MKELPSHCVNLKNFRKQKQMTLKQLAAEIGVSESYLKNIEYGCANPTYYFLEKFNKRFPEENINTMFFNSQK